MKLLFGVNALLLVLLAPSYLAAQDYPCANRIIPNGESSAQLTLQCGEPNWKQQLRTVEVFVITDNDTAGRGTAGRSTASRGAAGNDIAGKDTQRKSIITVEEWSYNLGPGNLNRIFTLQDGRVSDMRFAGYGFDKGQADRTPCSDQFILVGNSVAEVVGKCGEPSGKNRHEEVAQQQIDGSSVRKTTLFIEDWTFNSGPDRPLRVVTFREGKVSNIRDGENGYAAGRGRGSR